VDPKQGFGRNKRGLSKEIGVGRAKVGMGRNSDWFPAAGKKSRIVGDKGADWRSTFGQNGWEVINSRLGATEKG